jgi:hypothetical protein
MTNANELIGRLGACADLLYQAQEAVAKGNYQKATGILQGEVTPLVQTVSAEVWREHHVSGRVP